MSNRRAYQRTWEGLVRRVAQCELCSSVRRAGGGLQMLTRAGWTFRLGKGGLRFRCADCNARLDQAEPELAKCGVAS